MTQLRILDFQSDSGKTSRRRDVPGGPQGPVNPTSLSGTPQDTSISGPPGGGMMTSKESGRSGDWSSSLRGPDSVKKGKLHRDKNWLKELPRKIKENMDGFVQSCETEFPDDPAVKRYARMFEDGVDDRVDGRRKIDRKKLKHHEKLLAQRGEDFERQYRARIAYVLMRYVETKYPDSTEALK